MANKTQPEAVSRPAKRRRTNTDIPADAADLPPPRQRTTRRSTSNNTPQDKSQHEPPTPSAPPEPQPPPLAAATTTNSNAINSNHNNNNNNLPPASLPHRHHPQPYHTPLLLSSPSSRTALLEWFTARQSVRLMPWRKPFTPPSSLSRSALSRRAYEVWISEVMLQQTRASPALAERWQRWMDRWPTPRDLARASEQEVLAEWAGLGYYARAKRVLMAAKEVCGRTEGEGGEGEGVEPVLPGNVDGLMKLPGVGRYTAGAVAAIVFGVPAPMVDGNVLRVMSRQMGIYGDVKGDERVVGEIWKAAEELVKAVAADGEEEVNERPGLWGQALMELGSTVCAPKPDCAACPITGTCRVYQEAAAAAAAGKGKGKGKKVVGLGDIEDACSLCAPFEGAEEDDDEETNVSGNRKISHFFAKRPPSSAGNPQAEALETIINHARRFPLKKPTKPVRYEETLVCAIRSADDRFLIHRRPDTGLLAGMWELPSRPLELHEDVPSTQRSRKSEATPFARWAIKQSVGEAPKPRSIKHQCEVGTVQWQFSHLKQDMAVQLFEWNKPAAEIPPGPSARWATADEIDAETMGTGMKRCWTLVKKFLYEWTGGD
ncbi:hypothetical protein VTJ04DRAFT_10921 [Mycothermus thermophilus]|uniref:uncharacterized protein n=1 Tax=Humicola insolens TaxID=85995 RepID=UPI0037429EF3